VLVTLSAGKAGIRKYFTQSVSIDVLRSHPALDQVTVDAHGDGALTGSGQTGKP
jgi:hypothetical protein